MSYERLTNDVNGNVFFSARKRLATVQYRELCDLYFMPHFRVQVLLSHVRRVFELKIPSMKTKVVRMAEDIKTKLTRLSRIPS